MIRLGIFYLFIKGRWVIYELFCPFSLGEKIRNALYAMMTQNTNELKKCLKPHELESYGLVSIIFIFLFFFGKVK